MLNIFKSKKIIYSFLGLILIVATMPIFSAFEAHIVNVTATINNPVLLEYPNGGEIFTIGEAYNITWTADEGLPRLGNVSSVDLYYSIDGGNSYNIISANETNDGFYKWEIPDDFNPTTQGRIMVLAHYNGTDAPDQVDYSDEDFEIGNTVAFWKFDENSGSTVADETENNNDGTLMPASPTWVSGYSGNPLDFALDFNGTDDYVEVSDSDSLDITDEITIEAWIKTNLSDTQIILRKTYAYEIFIWNGHIGALIGTSSTWSGGNIREGSMNISDGQWHHVAMAYNDLNNSIKLYVDGSLDFEDSNYSVSMGTNNLDIYIGRESDVANPGYYFKGIIDEVRISNIAENFNGGGGEEDPLPVPPEPGEVVINEIMQNPEKSESDYKGEWFELYNTTDKILNLEGCIISDDGTDFHTIINSLNISFGDYIVLARESDLAKNGGINPDYVYGTDITLGNGADEIILTCNGTEINRVEYDDGLEFPDPTGASMILVFDDNGNYWCTSGTPPYGDGDYGTPGAENSPCSD